MGLIETVVSPIQPYSKILLIQQSSGINVRAEAYRIHRKTYCRVAPAGRI
jgi:hypothetical protein